jgi:hypothetical protein
MARYIEIKSAADIRNNILDVESSSRSGNSNPLRDSLSKWSSDINRDDKAPNRTIALKKVVT